MTNKFDSDSVNDMDHMSDDMDTDDVQETPKETVRDTTPRVLRDPVTGKFLAGTKAGPGRPKGLKDQLNVQVIETLEALWSKRGAEIIDQLAAEKPEVVAQLIARMIPQQLATEAITGEADKAQVNQDVTIRLVSDQRHEVLPSREVQGELMLPDDGDNVTH
jgi:hypothetical protein